MKKSEMTPLEAAEMLEDIAAVSGLKAVDGKRSGVAKIGRIDAEDLRYAASLLRAIAAGEYKRVVHARWIPKAMPLGMVYICSNCNYGVDQLTEHCPRCGARMDGKNDCHA